MRLPASLLLLLLLCGCASSSAPADFVFREERVDVGRAVHYVKSNLDGSKPVLVTMYVAARDRIEVYKSEKDVEDAADVLAHLDWTRFSADHLDAGVILESGEREPRAELTLRGTGLSVTLGDTSETLRVETFPLHVYNFDLMSLNIALPHLARPRSDFRVAFAEPTFGQKPGVMELRGFATAEFLGVEQLRGVATRKYRLTGPGMAGREGLLWVSEEDGLLERFESALPNNPGWNSLRLERHGSRRMSAEEWRTYKREHVGVGVE